MQKLIVTTGARIALEGAEPPHGEILLLLDQLSDRDARPGYADCAQSSRLVGKILTARERDVLAMISRGLSNKRIARARKISPETVKSHLKRIFSKLAVRTRAQAVSQAGSLGLLCGSGKGESSEANWKRTV